MRHGNPQVDRNKAVRGNYLVVESENKCRERSRRRRGGRREERH